MMKTKSIEVCDAIIYSISCMINDSEDVKCGGSPVLGYDFGVSPDENQKDIIKFLTECIKKYNRPFMGIDTYLQKDFPVKHLWTREKMEKCIKENGF